MLRKLLKSKSGGSAREAIPAWRPDFRDVELLPDLKTVRTTFFVNAGAITLALAALLATALRESKLRSLHGEIARAEDSIARLERPSKQAVATYGQFQTEAKTIEEIAGFAPVGSALSRSDLLIHLSQGLPPAIAFNRIEMRGGGVVLAGVARGSGTSAIQLISEYEKQLREDPVLKDIYGGVSQGGVVREVEDASRFRFEITLASKTPAKK